MNNRAMGRQREIIFDLAFYVGHAWRALDTTVASAVMDKVEGSRGLFVLVEEWALEFDAEWEKRPESGKEDYMSDIDAFAAKKFAELIELKPDVVSIQVLPVVNDNGEVTAQPGGPTADTNGWAVYLRNAAGLAPWVADALSEEIAMFIGEALAKKYDVHIESQLWKCAP